MDWIAFGGSTLWLLAAMGASWSMINFDLSQDAKIGIVAGLAISPALLALAYMTQQKKWRAHNV